MQVLVTGAAGFIGKHSAKRLLDLGDVVAGADNLNNHCYDIQPKHKRLSELEPYPRCRFERLDITNQDSTATLFAHEKFGRVDYLAAPAGVRYSLKNRHAYVESNLVGFVRILGECRQNCADHPVSLYAATKKAKELMAHTHSRNCCDAAA